MAFGSDDAEASEFGDQVAEADVGAASGHVGGDSDAPGVAGAGNDDGFVFVADGVEDGGIDAAGFKEVSKLFAGVDAAGADEDGLAGFVDTLDFVDNGGPFFFGVGEDLV